MPADAATPLAAARPVLTIDGADQGSLAQGLLAMRIADEADGIAHCELSFGNWGATQGTTSFLHFDRRLLDFGKTLVVKIAGQPVFDGRITALEAHFPEGQPPALTVLAEDRLQDLRMCRRTRTFEDRDDAGILRSVAQEHGLSADVDVRGGTHRVVAQVAQSDLAFLRDRVRAAGAELWAEGSTLKARPRADRAPGGTPPRLRYGGELRELTIAADLAHQRTKVDVAGWDVAGKRALRESAGQQAIASEAAGGETGAQVLSSSLGDRPELVTGSVPLTSAEARAWAEAAFRRRARRFVTGRGVAVADPRLRVGAVVRLEGVGPLFSGDAYVAAVVHRFDGVEGLRTEVAVERPSIGQAR